MTGRSIAKITHYFNKINVAVLGLTSEIKVGDRIHILGHTTDFQQGVGSLQIDHTPVVQASPGDDVALKVAGRVRPGDVVYKMIVGG